MDPKTWPVGLLIVMSLALAGCGGTDEVETAPGEATDPKEETGSRDPAETPDERGSSGRPDERGNSVWNETVETKPYTGHGLGPFGLNTGCEWGPWEPGGPDNLGAACFEVIPGTIQVEFKVEDDLFPDPVGAYVRFDTPGDPPGHFCGTGEFAVPPGTQWFMVLPHAQVLCWIGGDVAAPTEGTITVTMTHP